MANTSQMKRGFLLLGCICVVGLLLAKVGGHSRSAVNRPGDVLDQRGVDFAEFLIEGDVTNGLSGSDSMLGSFSREQLLEWSGLDAETAAREYEERYDANEIAADQAYKDKKLLVKGTISTIEKDFTGDGYLTLRGTNPFIGIKADLSDRSAREAASFRRGQAITLVCHGAGRIVTIAVLSDCLTLDDYELAIKPMIDDRVRGFLTGRTSLPRRVAHAIAMAYQVGITLPTDSACSQHDVPTCSNWMKDKGGDPAWHKSMQDRSAQLLTALRVSAN